MSRRVTVGVTAAGSGIGQVVLDGLRACGLDVRIVAFELSGWSAGLFSGDVAYRLPHPREDGFGPRLLEVCRQTGMRLLIPGSDTEALRLAELAPELAGYGCVVPIADPAVVRLCRDKKAMFDFFRGCQAPFAQTWLLDEALARLGQGDDLPYPLIVKPRGGSGSVGVRVVTAPEDWPAVLGEIRGGERSEWIVQPFLRSVTWNDEHWDAVAERGYLLQRQQVAVQYLFSEDGELISSMTSLISLKAGVAMASDSFEDPDVSQAAERCRAALAPLGLKGPLNLQGIWTANGVEFFEANPRFTGSSHVRALLGYGEVEATVRHFAMGESLASVRERLRPDLGRVGVRQMTERVVPRSWIEQFERTGTLAPPLPVRRVLLTGATGYLGRAVLDALLALDPAIEVVAPVRRADDLQTACFEAVSAGRLQVLPWTTTAELPGVPGIDLVIHAAAVRPLAAAAQETVFGENLSLDAAVFDAVRRYQIPYLAQISSQSVYAASPGLPWTEEHAVVPSSPYGYAKAAGEAAVRLLPSPPTRWVILRLGRLYGLGSGMRRNELCPRFLERALRGQPLLINGTGHQQIDLVHIRDVAALVVGLAAAPEAGWNQVYNVGSSAPITIRALAEHCMALADEHGRNGARLDLHELATSPPSFALDSTRVREVLGWKPRINLLAGLREIRDAWLADGA